jgi:hypothetical protein
VVRRQLCDAAWFGWGAGTTTGSGTAVRRALPAGTAVVAVRAGSQQRLALTSADQILPWEGNLAEDPGNGSRNDSDTPVTAHLATGPLPAIDAGPGS